MGVVRTIGIVGSGQLARMMQAPAIGLGLRLRVLAEKAGTSAAQVMPDVTVDDYSDVDALASFAACCDAITFDHEHVPTALLRRLAGAGVTVRPGPDALEHAQDKLVMRKRLTELGLPVPAWRECASVHDVVAFGEEYGWPVIAKVSRGGYDGKGVLKIADAPGAASAFEALGRPVGPTERETGAEASHPVSVLVEEFVPFVRELSVLVARRAGGERVVYPVTETVQVDGICRETTTPAPGLSAEQDLECGALAVRIADELDVVGVLAVELMQRADSSVVVNELAMRPHNTGHWTIDGAVTSQFENHLRAVADLPLGSPRARASVVVMANVLGGAKPDVLAELASVLAVDPEVRVQLYGKDVLPGRKVGHVTAYGDDVGQVRARARAAAAQLEGMNDE